MEEALFDQSNRIINLKHLTERNKGVHESIQNYLIPAEDWPYDINHISTKPRYPTEHLEMIELRNMLICISGP